jgi:lipopolysaccharide/colanic/teichoic acid biosynthesis glycosyltransferase
MARSEGQSGFFGHTRIGRDGVAFKCWKIRTMISDAEDLLQSHLNADPELAQEWASTFKLKNDPRITQRGAFLRQSGLDELPQLWNVLRGEMSIVGPRPVPRDELVKKYAQHSGVYKKMRPGITGIWQVSGRGNCSYPERVRMDAHYAENASLTLDVSIVLRTIGAVLRKTGS